ncbi:MAG: TrkH family potassium uptake protein [Pirellulales bacterium]|nr:TrkH family potassium uptake protein [Pirellulales bacterium]
MNYGLVLRSLSFVALLTGGFMLFSLPWASPSLGPAREFEQSGFLSLLYSAGICFAVWYLLRFLGRNHDKLPMYRKEAMAVVGLSWVMVTFLGGLPFLFNETPREDGLAMTFADAMFESQSGFSTTGATVITDLEKVDKCILFWRSSTHFLGGLGIIVLFVAILGHGSAGKALMRAEMPGPTKEGSTARMQQTAWRFAAIYVVLNVILALALIFLGLDLFDALCHAFGTMATGGFSTHNESLGYFALHPEEYKAEWIEMTVMLFMLLAGTNFTLLFFLVLRKFRLLWFDVEWRSYLGIIALATLLVMGFGLYHGDFSQWWEAFRYGSFQVVAIVTTTGYGTHDFDGWNNFGRGLLFLLMFIGGCAGSTGGGLKVIRHVLFFKILRLELEQSYHPSVVRPLRVGGHPVDDPDLRKNILVYFAIALFLMVTCWLIMIAFEPDDTWQVLLPAEGLSSPVEGPSAEQISLDNKLIDSASAIAATLNNIGPGLGAIGATQNYSRFTWWTKLFLFTPLMMLGRLEFFPIIVLVLPRFWRSR